MEKWLVIVIAICIATVIRSILLRRKKLPPGPSLLHSGFLILTNSPWTFESVLITLKSRYGPIFTLSTGFGPYIFVSDHSLTHHILVKAGAVFADRPKEFLYFNTNSYAYGPTWRLLRRNMASEILHPTRIKSYSWARKWSLHVLITRLLEQQDPVAGVKVVDHFCNAIVRLVVAMCFGDKVDDARVDEISKVNRETLLSFVSGRFTMINKFRGRLGRLLFRNIWKQFEKLRDDKERALVPLIKARIESPRSESGIVAYVDTLVNLRLPVDEATDENSGKLSQREMVDLCTEFINGGTDTTWCALQWIMANLVKHPHIQSKLYDEIVAVMGPPPPPPRKEDETELESVINEEDLQKMPYLKAVVLEGLRRHPPGHLVAPHRVMKEVEVEGYMIPEGATINFMVNEMALDPKVWDDPMEFKPERFLTNDDVFDISGSKEIKMMPFGAGRRMCPGYGLAMLHLEYFVANLIWYFDWTVPDGYHVDLSEKLEAAVVMKNPLRARIASRSEK